MWKDFFNFNKRERMTLIALTLLILLIQVFIWTKDSWIKFLPANLEQKYVQKKALEAYRDSVTAIKPRYSSYQRSNMKRERSQPLKLVRFNPNTADSSTLLALGLRSYVVKNILNYRRKGGQFRKSSDFARIYGMDSTIFATLEPLIELEAKGQGGIITEFPEKYHSPTTPQPAAQHDGIRTAHTETPSVEASKMQDVANRTFDLNTADTALLLQLKGIGSYTANRIARYRNQLGGFYSVTQLSEIKGLYPETLARLQAMTTIDHTRINRLEVNKASLEKLRAHPYLSFYQAKVIVELRKSRGKLNSIEDLTPFKEFSPDDLQKLKWYLAF